MEIEKVCIQNKHMKVSENAQKANNGINITVEMISTMIRIV